MTGSRGGKFKETSLQISHLCAVISGKNGSNVSGVESQVIIKHAWYTWKDSFEELGYGVSLQRLTEFYEAKCDAGEDIATKAEPKRYSPDWSILHSGVGLTTLTSRAKQISAATLLIEATGEKPGATQAGAPTSHTGALICQ